jgi:hypothetical protein
MTPSTIPRCSITAATASAIATSDERRPVEAPWPGWSKATAR